MELSSSKIKKVLIFSLKELLLYFGKWNFLTFYILGGNFLKLSEKKCVKDKKYCKVRDHCHYTRQYRGAAHIICNLKYSVGKKNYIAFHNLSNSDNILS